MKRRERKWRNVRGGKEEGDDEEHGNIQVQ